MRRGSSAVLWAAFPLLALRIEGPSLRLSPAFVADTIVRLAVWALLTLSLIRAEWPGVFGASLAIFGLGLIALGLRWYADRKGWRQRWLQN